MKKAWLLVAVLVHCVGLRGTVGSSKECQPQPTCTECLRSPGCAWCKQKVFLMPGEPNERRCATAKALKEKDCKEEHVIDPKPHKDPMKDNNLRNDPHNVVQLRPQNLHLKLRIGVPQTFEVMFKRAEGYPIDLYYLMDLSYSMKDDLEKIKNLGQEILSNLTRVTNSVRIGFGSFVDKEAMPYVSQVKAKLANPCPSRLDTCQPAFSFKNVLPLTSDAAEFKDRVSNQKISGNLDSPEGGFDAMMQAAVCQEYIGWNNDTRILVYTSDDTFHMAGDGRLAGIYQPNDGKCHLNSEGYYEQGTTYDYPSVGHLSKVLSANNIQLIFAVTERSIPSYQALSKLIPQSVVGVLKDDSSNVVQLISEAYGNLSSTILLEHQHAPPELEISYQSHCSIGVHSQWRKRGECSNVKINQQVNFTVSLNISSCLAKSETFVIKPQGISEELKITVETLCDCNCKDQEERSPHCNASGTLSCGICSCDEGHLGQRCECEKQLAGDTMLAVEALCWETNTSQLCSGQGNCECGHCVCRGNHRGQFCECDDTSCPRYNNELCAGKGTCKCGVCECHSNYTGQDCQCSSLTDGCEAKSRKICSGHGECKCNKCNCHPDFYGAHCSMIKPNCQKYQACVLCAINGSCSEECDSVKVEKLPDLKNYTCQHPKVHFKIDLDTNSDITILYTDPPGPTDKTPVIAGSAVSGIVFIGIAVIIVYRLLLEMYYRREYHNFIKEQSNAKWDETPNPLFKGATTTVYNPMHVQE
ncbi:integrin beta-7-like [Megalops cyprinoides]|uniref:integrin beta-7-like n=1 Tax=Megalops cyprinoides TaxID=118141 RepID=UPI001864BAA3|nr:integrin beta-7-like [Megalops cyprinoides]